MAVCEKCGIELHGGLVGLCIRCQPISWLIKYYTYLTEFRSRIKEYGQCRAKSTIIGKVIKD